MCDTTSSSLKKPKIIAIIGPTASGKTSLGCQIIDEFGGQIISADALQVYHYLDIGTAKPLPKTLQQYPHHLINVRFPDQYYNAGAFVQDATKIIQQHQKQNQLSIIVGGTHLYLKALVHGIIQVTKISSTVKEQVQFLYQTQGLKKCYEQLEKIDPESYQKLHPNDTARILRALEVILQTGKSIQTLQKQHQFNDEHYQTLYLAINFTRDVLYQRINQRIITMINSGLIEECQQLIKMGYSPELRPLQSIGYKETFQYLAGQINQSTMISEIQKNSRHYAKRQLTWCRANQQVQWNSPNDFSNVKQLIQNFLSD